MPDLLPSFFLSRKHENVPTFLRRKIIETSNCRNADRYLWNDPEGEREGCARSLMGWMAGLLLR